jgi:two-component system sensor histidine kinase DegS
MATDQVSFADLGRLIESEAAKLDRELSEIDLLIQQAKIEAGRHEQKRAQTADRYGVPDPSRQPGQAREQMEQLMTLTKRASLMEAQVDILEGKQKALTRYRDTMRDLAQKLENVAIVPQDELLNGAGGGDGSEMPPALTRAILGAQENLRREIARQMHDGPAQSLTNIVLQAQIVERLVRRDPQQAQSEIAQLIDMVQHTLDATKTFIFEVRPMVLDDLGLVPTLRRMVREQARRTGVEMTFDSVGADQRLPADLESGLFRIIDDAAVGFAKTSPGRVAVRLEWSEDEVHATVTAMRDDDPEPTAPSGSPSERARLLRRRERGADVPPALAALIEEERADAAAESEAAANAIARARALPDAVWKEIRQRAGPLGVDVTLSEDGRTLDVRARFGR